MKTVPAAGDYPSANDHSDLFQELRLDYGDNRFANLKKAVETSFQSLEPFRNLYKNLVENYAGPGYGTPADKRPKYINKMAQIVDAYMMLLAANRPQVEISTKHRELQGFARHFGSSLNHMIEEIHLEETIRRWVMDAFFTIGVVRVHLKNSLEVEFENNIWMDPGTPFASNVSPHDFVFDMSVKTWPEVKFVGNIYQITVEDLQKGVKMGVYDVDEANTITQRSRSDSSGERVEELTRDSMVEEYDKTVDLCDIYVSKDRKIYTFAVSSRNKFTISTKPLAEMDWDEHDCTPYHILGFNDVPDNIMPVSPASNFNELDRLINSLYRKAARQALRQKENPTFAAGSEEDANNIKKANDGEWIKVLDPTKLGLQRSNGADPSNMAFTQGAKDELDMLAGNIPSMLGLAQQGDTLGQEELIHSAGNRKIGQMQYRVLDATRKLIKSLGYMLWQDEFKQIVSTMEVTADYEAPVHWQPGDREGNFLDYNFDVNVYSMAYRPPAAQAEIAIQLLTGVVFPGVDMLMQQGGTIDYSVLIRELSRRMGVEWMEDVVKFTNPPPEDDDGPTTDSGPRKAPVTTRNYTRRSEAQPQQSGIAKQQQWLQMAGQQQQPNPGGMGQ